MHRHAAPCAAHHHHALREIHFRGDAIIELAHERDFKPTRPLRESLRMSCDFARKLLNY